MFKPIRIAPSILSCDFMDMASQIAMIEEGGADLVHVDVMDGHFVPNITIGVPHVKQLKRISRLPLDVHLMIDNPMTQIPWFTDAGADMLTVHAETLEGAWVERAADLIHSGGAQAGLALKPNTPVATIKDAIGLFDMVLVMSVEPGFSGQSYIEGSDEKVAEAVRAARAQGADVLMEVDGGMGMKTVGKVTSAGADVIVCGNAVFKADDPVAAISAIRQAGDASRLAAQERQL